MVRVSKDFADPGTTPYAIACLHQGPAGPGNGRTHLLQVVSPELVPAEASCSILFTSAQLADEALLDYVGRPLIIQDLCLTCAPYPYRPSWPRENRYRSDHAYEITPCVAEDWV